MERIKIAVVGTGRLGGVHAKLWNQNTGATLVGVYDTDSARAATVAKEQGCGVFETLENAIDASDAVTIAAPTTAHYQIAARCIERGKHCLIEKPITSRYDDAKKLIAAAKKADVVVQVGHVERFNPAIAAVKDYHIEPLFIEAHRLSQFKPRAIDVSVIHDLMIHDVDIVLWMIKSSVKSIVANGVAVLTPTTDIANARISFDNGAVANITASRISAHPMRKMRLFQRDAYISIDFGLQEAEVFRLMEKGDGDAVHGDAVPATMLGSLETVLKDKNIYYEKPTAPKLNAIAEEQKAFVESIVSGAPVPVGVEEAAEALRIVEEIAAQIEAGR